MDKEKKSITDLLQTAVSSGDFDEFNHRINEMVDSAINTAGNLIATGTTTAKSYAQSMNEIAKKQAEAKKKKNLAPMAKKAPGTISGPIMLVFGVVLLVLSLGLGALSWMSGVFSYTAWILILPIILAVYLIYKGSSLNKRTKIYEAFKRAFGDRPYAAIEELAETARISKHAAIDKLKDFIALNLYPEGSLTDRGEYFLLSPGAGEVLQNDLQLAEQQRQLAEQQRVLSERYPKLADARDAIEEALATIDEMRRTKTALKKKQLSDELDKLEMLLVNIEDYITENPQNVKNIRSFLDYFLPTVVKLLNTYCDLDDETIQTDNIVNSKAEIESSLQSINLAFENMYDGFFSSAAMDISSDISVLNTMFAQKGLTDSKFKK